LRVYRRPLENGKIGEYANKGEQWTGSRSQRKEVFQSKWTIMETHLRTELNESPYQKRAME
jgi:hypothetical protein